MSLGDLSIYFQTVQQQFANTEGTLSEKIVAFQSDFPEIKKNSIVFFDCPEFRNSSFEVANDSKDYFREYLYTMSFLDKWTFDIYDLGTIKPGQTVEDSYFALNTVISELVKNDCLPIVIGGSQDLTYAIYQAYQRLEQTVNITTIDSQLDLGTPDQSLSDRNYISHILTSRPCTLFNYSIIGTQQPFLQKNDVQLMDKLYFDYCRLGELVSDFTKAEPLIRNSDILSIDMTALKLADVRCEYYDNPNGVAPEMICQIARYAGISDRLSSFAITNYFSTQTSNLTNNLVAQIIWYFIDGVGARYNDFPVVSLNDYMKFNVSLVDMGEEIIFYKSLKSERWWMQVPYPKKKALDFNRHTVVPCNYEDYLKAMENDIPDLWWKTYQKLL